MLRVFVALGKEMPKNKKMVEDTAEVARMLAKYNCTLVQGGAKMGLMGVVLEEFQKFSDEVVLIVPKAHKADIKDTISKESHIVEGEADRLKMTIATCDLIVVLPGGTGTLTELAYYNETKKSGENKARIVMINTSGFFNKLIKFINHQTKNGFMKKGDFKFDLINNANQLESIVKELIIEKQSILNDEPEIIKEVKPQIKDKPINKKTTLKTNNKSTNSINKPIKETKSTKIKDAKPESNSTNKSVKIASKNDSKTIKVVEPKKVEFKTNSKSKHIKSSDENNASIKTKTEISKKSLSKTNLVKGVNVSKEAVKAIKTNKEAKTTATKNTAVKTAKPTAKTTKVIKKTSKK